MLNKVRNKRAPAIVNIYNFIRKTVYPSGEFVQDDFDTVMYQMEILKQYGLPATYALKYDALIDERFSNLIKNNIDEYDEVAAWWEIDENLAFKANVKWKGNTPVDDHVNIGYSLGYSKEDRIKMVDVYMADFKEVFGYYPKSVGSWVMDIITFTHFREKYGVVCGALCRDQIGTDGFTLWGGYFNQGYYPSKINEYMPAQREEMQLDLPIFKLLGPDPIYAFEDGLRKSVEGVHTLEPACVIGQTEEWVKWLFDRFLEESVLGFSHVQVGQENTFLWNTMYKGYELQIPYVAKLAKEGKVRVETLEETGTWYKNKYKLTPPTTFTASEDWNKEENLKTTWYNSRFYRTSFLMEKGKLSIRDLHLFNENYKSRYYDETLESSESIFDALPILNAHKFSTDAFRASIDFVKVDEYIRKTYLSGEEVKFIGDGEKSYKVKWNCNSKESVCVDLNEDNMKIVMSGGNLNKEKLALHINTLPVLKDINNTTLICEHNGFKYKVFLKKGKFKLCEDGTIFIISENNIIEILFNNEEEKEFGFYKDSYLENKDIIDNYIPKYKRGNGLSKVKPRAFKPKIIPNVLLKEKFEDGTFKIENSYDNGIVHYTLDGSEPLESSPVYKDEIVLKGKATIKARAFKSGFKASEIVEGYLYETIKIKDIKSITNPVQMKKYNKKGAYDLIDGVKGSKDYTDGAWLGFHEDMDVIVDLGEVREINEVTVGFLQDTRAWIYYPKYVKFMISLNGDTFKEIKEIDCDKSIKREEVCVENIFSKCEGKARYIRVFAKNQDNCPDWSIMAGEGPAFMFVDQVTII
ncbi:MAG: chitobiase/beta-hexosaminidase C-terminal domain-containing protein [Clostridium sp.]|uniref:chitobiase/beta-hexosaminidase C-terminal domain-containing protein n=1 Tax=Clostridium sp. TaxID=1506 RepID=UPI003F3168E7